MVKNVLEYLKQSARDCPEKTAFADQDESVSFYETNERARKTGTQILERISGTHKKPIAVYMDKSADCLCAFFGIVYSGNFYVPLDVKSPLSRIETILRVLQPELIVTQEKYVERLAGHFSREKLMVPSPYMEADENVLSASLKEQLDVDPLYVLFTSGSTGIPKGVVISHKAVIDYTEWLSDFFGFDGETIFGNQAPFYFDNSILDIYSTLKHAATMHIIPEHLFSFSGELMQYLEERKINTIFWVPSALIGVANSGILGSFRGGSLKKILFAGEVMPNKQLNIWRKAVPDALYANLYGPTEITVDCTCYVIDREFSDDEPLPIGYPCNNMEILVLNEENQLCKGGETGELCVRGTGLALGYFGDEIRSKEVFVQNPLNPYWNDLIYRTGDLVSYNPHGELDYLGRKDYQIKHSGYRIELGEIEKAASSIAKVYRACALYDDEQKKIILAAVCGSGLTKKQIYQALKKKLPAYMLPAEIYLADEFPLNANGKIDRYSLKKEIFGGGLK